MGRFGRKFPCRLSPHLPASVALRRGERAIVIDLSSEAFGVGGWRLWEILRRFGKFWECLGEKSLPPFAAFAGGSVHGRLMPPFSSYDSPSSHSYTLKSFHFCFSFSSETFSSGRTSGANIESRNSCMKSTNSQSIGANASSGMLFSARSMRST